MVFEVAVLGEAHDELEVSTTDIAEPLASDDEA